ncbi:MAG: hypothetical protein APF84_17830 [Gracilibacter sp. BRH_c7a]|nr:MAG: hypothetical protein APF84_17830 [Gracilibacter sp. BRH_c7a]
MKATLKYENLSVGQSDKLEREITQNMVNNFADLTGDYNPVHIDQAFCEKLGLIGPIAHGMLTISLLSTFIGMFLPGNGSIIMNQTADYLLPVRVGDKVKIFGKITDKKMGDGLNLQIITIKYNIKNQNDQTVVRGTVKVNLK